MLVNGKHYRTVWFEDDSVKMINQPLLPHKFEIVEFKTCKKVADAVTTMVTRGAGAIGVSAAYGTALAVMQDKMEEIEILRKSRPTAQNLFTGIDFVLNNIKDLQGDEKKKVALEKAEEFANYDVEACKKIGKYGNELIRDGCNFMTICNAGWLAFTDWGSALSPVYVAKRAGKKIIVYPHITGPRNQGGRLTAWELANEGIEHYIIADHATAIVMERKGIDLVITGADRIAANGDTANKLGTYDLAVLCKRFNVPFYIAAPTTTIDLESKTGKDIPIEERSQDEVKYGIGYMEELKKVGKILLVNKDSKAINYAFDVTPADLIKGIITEKGIIKPNEEEIRKLF